MEGSTDLVLSAFEVTPYSVRGAKQTIEPIDASKNLRRTINGALVDLSVAQMRKYKTTISCSDQQPPAFDGIWPGLSLTIACIVEFCYRTAGGTPERTPVCGSTREEGNFTFYRPIITGRVTGFNVTRDEWGAVVDWQLECEEG